MRGESTYADWIAVDWGTSNLRVWAMTTAGGIRAEDRSDDGMGSLAPEQFEPALLRLIEPWLGQRRTHVIACGMVGSRQGWVEAPYRAVPCKPLGTLTPAPVRDGRIAVSVLSGLKQTSPADVMRGEETQIAGYLDAFPHFDGVLCLPGTHTKWVHVSAGEIVSFQTFMSGEIFATLSSQSVLRHSVTAAGWDADAFETAVSDAISKPEAVAARLFNLRARDLLEGASKTSLKARLSGLLIGAELAASKPYWLGQPVALIGAEKLASHYARALALQGVAATCHDSDTQTLRGLGAAHKEISK